MMLGKLFSFHLHNSLDQSYDPKSITTWLKQITKQCDHGIEHTHFQISSQDPGKSCWDPWVLYGEPKNYTNPHKDWTGGKDKPESIIKGKKFPKKKLTFPVQCKTT